MEFIKTNWKNILENIIDEEEIENIFIEHEKKYGNDIKIFPPKNLIYNCFNHFDFEDLKVVILGQDPYINEGEAMGLSFSVPDKCKMPPSLRNIFKEIKSDLGIEISSTDLTPWAKQGVLLMNCALTVCQHKSNSHKKHWNKYTDKIIKYISENHSDIIFILWGNFAKNKKKFIDTEKHIILESVHPSPLSARRGFFGCKHFSKVLEYKKINW